MKTNLLSLLAISTLMVGCADDGKELFDSVEPRQSRSGERDTIMIDTITPMVMTDDIMSLQEILDNFKRPMRAVADYEEDPYIDKNIYALRDIPVSIEVAEVGQNSKSTRRWIRTRGKGVDLMLDYDYMKKNWGFRINPMPVTTGLHYLLYSDDLNVPLTIGKLKDGTAVIMAQKNDDKFTDFVSWDIIPSETNPGYFQIRSTHYLGQASTSDPFSIFNYTLEASKDNNLRFMQPVSGKKQQEFCIKPMDASVKFTFDSVIYNIQTAKVTGPYYTRMTKSIENLLPETASLNIIFDFNVAETSRFKTVFGNIFPTIVESTNNLKRPVLLGNIVKEPAGNTPKDAPYQDWPECKISKRIFYRFPVFVSPKHVYNATLDFQYNFVTVDYEVTAYYTDGNGIKREMSLEGTWTGKMYQDPSIVGPRIIYSGEKPMIEGGGDIEL